jgi:hypothetical protein
MMLTGTAREKTRSDERVSTEPGAVHETVPRG